MLAVQVRKRAPLGALCISPPERSSRRSLGLCLHIRPQMPTSSCQELVRYSLGVPLWNGSISPRPKDQLETSDTILILHAQQSISKTPVLTSVVTPAISLTTRDDQSNARFCQITHPSDINTTI